MSPLPFLLATLFLDAVGIGIAYPVLPDLIADVGVGRVEDAALWGGLLATAYALMQFLCAPVLGALSDRWGRRPVLLASLAVMALDYVGSALAGSMWLLLLLRVVAGVAGATHATANAAMADITPPEWRSQRFGLLSAAFMGGFILGPVIGGALGDLDPRLPFWAAAAMAAGNLLLGWLAFPETVTDATRRPLTLARANPFGAMRAVARLRGALPLLAVLGLLELAYVSYVAVWSFWGKAAFGWTPWLTGLSLAAFGVGAMVAHGWLIRVYIRRLGERGTIRFALLYTLAFFVIYGLLPHGALGGLLAILLCPVSALGEVAMPAIQGQVSRLAPPDAQGEATGVVASVRSAAQVAGPLVMTGVFAWGLDAGSWPLLGAPYLLGAALTALCLVILARAPGRAPA